MSKTNFKFDPEIAELFENPNNGIISIAEFERILNDEGLTFDDILYQQSNKRKRNDNNDNNDNHKKSRGVKELLV